MAMSEFTSAAPSMLGVSGSYICGSKILFILYFCSKGRDQVAVGVAPIGFANKSSESALSIYPLAIANCKEKRDNLKQLLRNLNSQKNCIKKHGIVVDGRKYKIKFTVTLDYKALLLLLNKKNDEDFTLGGKGYNVECCAYCDAIRACTSHGADPDEACLDCLRSKANIGR
ncbi:uncharacterized protein LOC110057799 [Orbicella faveolata]|uniref:uncharacterized protein LOC110057799 n=1 Tax=Orbicella faveolata TaxID=48498 RepID=UPI0009E4F3B1|nr:uncharacterized protein LOC110057799 [Orbicella faveolata]